MSNVVDEKVESSSDMPNSNEALSKRPSGIRGLYSHPITQVTMLGFVCFMCPGLFNALNGLGAGGQVDSETSANSNAALYATFSVSAFFAGSINNVLGSRLTLLMGSIGYALYIGSYLTMNIHPDSGGFVIAAGAVLGICAGLLWTAQGSLMLSYPTESQKGRFISIFWSIFNMGGVVGAAVSLGLNFKSNANSVGNGTYIAFLVLTLIGVIIPLFMVDPKQMIRTNGTTVTIPLHPSWKSEIKGLYIAIKTDPLILLLLPMFFTSNWFYTWQFNNYNAALFDIRARSLNNFIYWIAQIIGSVLIGFLLDQKKISRRTRAFSGWSALFVMVWVVHIWAYFYQRQYTRESALVEPKIDIYSSGYPAKIWLYCFCGLLDAMWQITVYWIIGAMSNDPAKLAHFTGLCAAGVWRADGVKLPFMNIFVSTWALLVAGLVFAFPMIYLRVKDTTEGIEDTSLPVEKDITELEK